MSTSIIGTALPRIRPVNEGLLKERGAIHNFGVAQPVSCRLRRFHRFAREFSVIRSTP